QIIHAGVNLDGFTTTREAARRTLHLPDGIPVAAIIARLSPEKNHLGLLEAWSHVVRELPDAVLLIAGGGPEEETLRSEIQRLQLEDRVQLLGVRRDVANILAACDVFVLCSDRE